MLSRNWPERKTGMSSITRTVEPSSAFLRYCVGAWKPRLPTVKRATCRRASGARVLVISAAYLTVSAYADASMDRLGSCQQLRRDWFLREYSLPVLLDVDLVPAKALTTDESNDAFGDDDLAEDTALLVDLDVNVQPSFVVHPVGCQQRLSATEAPKLVVPLRHVPTLRAGWTEPSRRGP